MRKVVMGSSNGHIESVYSGIDCSDTFLVVGTPEYFNDARCFLHFEYACEKKKKIAVVIEHGECLPADFQKLLDQHGATVALYVRGDGELFVDAMNRVTAELMGAD